jgi:flagellar hook-associated protein 1 FlgK
MSLTHAMMASLSGLKTSRKGLGIESANIANAFTEDYTKKVLPLASCVKGGQSCGVVSGPAVRQVDTFLLERIRRNMSDLEVSVVQQNFLERIQEFLGQPGQNNALTLSVSRFAATMQAVNARPADQASKLAMVEAARVLAENISTIAHEVQKIRQDADRQISQTVSGVNDALHTVARLNGLIARGLAMKKPVGDLEDQRDKCLETIASALNVHVEEDRHGCVWIETSAGRSLLAADDVFEIGYQPTALVTATSEYRSAAMGGVSTLSALSLRGEDITQVLSGGQLKGLLELRDTLLPGIQQSMDGLAAEFQGALNAISNEGSAFQAGPSLTSTVSFAGIGDAMGPLGGGLRVTAVDQGTGRVVTTADLDLGTIAGGNPTVDEFLQAFNDHWNAHDIQAELSEGDHGFLVISTTRPGCGVAMGAVSGQALPMGNGAQGFSASMGFNDLLLGTGDAQGRGLANTLAVNPVFLNQASAFPQGWLNRAAVLNPGDVALTPGDTRTLQSMIQAMQARNAFPAAGPLGPFTGTFEQYARVVISEYATLTGQRAGNAAQQEKSLEQLRVLEQNTHGVDLDEAMFHVMTLQAAYNANFQVMRAAQEMLDKMESMIR